MGFRVNYFEPSREETKRSCYWSLNKKESEDYADMVRRMFPQYVVEVVVG